MQSKEFIVKNEFMSGSDSYFFGLFSTPPNVGSAVIIQIKHSKYKITIF